MKWFIGMSRGVRESERDHNSKNLYVHNSNNADFFISDVEGSTLLTNWWWWWGFG
jgi:hypothetical protein